MEIILMSHWEIIHLAYHLGISQIKRS